MIHGILRFYKKIRFTLPLVGILTMQPYDIRAEGFTLQSQAFQNGQPIPAKHSNSAENTAPQSNCRGKNISPELSWSHAPAGTKSFALIVTDPDVPGGTRTHWILFDLPATQTTLPEGIVKLPEGAKQGLNSREKSRYAGPCPPPGTGAHRYFFDLYALDTMLTLPEGSTKESLLKALEGHILGKATLMGTFTYQQAAQ